MGLLSIVIAALAAWMFGAIWYMALSKPWVAAAGITVDENGRPSSEGKSQLAMILPFILSALAMLIVAGFMRHIFAMAGIDELAKGLVAGLGIGLFFISPWIMINNAYGFRPFKLTLIDSGYATFGSAIIGAVLTLF